MPQISSRIKHLRTGPDSLLNSAVAQWLMSARGTWAGSIRKTGEENIGSPNTLPFILTSSYHLQG